MAVNIGPKTVFPCCLSLFNHKVCQNDPTTGVQSKNNWTSSATLARNSTNSKVPSWMIDFSDDRVTDHLGPPADQQFDPICNEKNHSHALFTASELMLACSHTSVITGSMWNIGVTVTGCRPLLVLIGKSRSSLLNNNQY